MKMAFHRLTESELAGLKFILTEMFPRGSFLWVVIAFGYKRCSL